MLFGPGATVGKRAEVVKRVDNKQQEYKSCLDPLGHFDVLRRRIECHGETEDGEVECRKIVMQEQLSLHQEKREVMQTPSERKESTGLVVYTQKS